MVDAIVAAITAVPGAILLGAEMDADHNRSVLTFAGEPEPVMEAAFRAVATAKQRIDLNHHKGAHPRMGAADVVPFVPVEGLTLDDCAALARQVGERIGRELEIPVFLYESAASRPDRVSLADVRRGEFEGLRERIGVDPDRAPDFGPARIHPTAGATAVGARRFLVAFNANLNTSDVRVAKAVAATVREGSGGLKNVRALGFSIENGRRAQVSMNLVNTEATPIHRVLHLVRAEAARHGAAISGCEVVGLIPQAALFDAAEAALQLEGFSRDQVLELRLGKPPLAGAVPVQQFFDQVAGPSPTPGGGTVAAFTAALAATLPVMVAGLTLGKKKYAAAEDDMRRIRAEADALRGELLTLGRQDGEAFDNVLRARRMPQSTPAEVEARDREVMAAELEASRVPLRTAEACVRVAELAALAAEKGHVNAVSDAGVAGLLARAAGEGALLNVQINLKFMADSADKTDVLRGATLAGHALGEAARRCEAAVRAVLNA